MRGLAEFNYTTEKRSKWVVEQCLCLLCCNIMFTNRSTKVSTGWSKIDSDTQNIFALHCFFQNYFQHFLRVSYAVKFNVKGS